VSAEVVTVVGGTGEIVDRRPVISTPSAPMTALDIANQCRNVEVWAESCTSIEELKEADHRLAAIAEYVKRTSTEGRAKVEAARRRLEVRIGQLLGPAPDPSESKRTDLDPSLASEGSELTPNQRSQSRAMADHPEIVEAVIDESDDATPASRRRVLDEINRAKQAPPEEIHARTVALAAKELHKAGQFFAMFTPEQIRELNDPDITEGVRLLMHVIAPWWDTYKATKPAGLVVHQGGKQ
jgi:hypothetical protein